MRQLKRLRSSLVLFVAVAGPRVDGQLGRRGHAHESLGPAGCQRAAGGVARRAGSPGQVRPGSWRPLTTLRLHGRGVERPGRDPTSSRPTITRLSPTCVAADIVTLDPGLATGEARGEQRGRHADPQAPVPRDLADDRDPAIDEVGASDPTGTTRLGDPAGDGVFNAGGAVGRVQVQVKGTFPHPLGPGGKLHPARRLGDDRRSPGRRRGLQPGQRHRLLGHPRRPDQEGRPPSGLPSFCPDRVPVPPPAVDAVDNCRGNPVNYGEAGPFSRYFGDGILALGPSIRTARS